MANSPALWNILKPTLKESPTKMNTLTAPTPYPMTSRQPSYHRVNPTTGLSERVTDVGSPENDKDFADGNYYLTVSSAVNAAILGRHATQMN